MTRQKPYSPDVKSPIQIAPIFNVGLQNLGTKRFVQSTGCFLLVSESWFLCCVRQITDNEILFILLKKTTIKLFVMQLRQLGTEVRGRAVRKEVLKELLPSGFSTETWIVETLPALTFTYRFSVLGLNRLDSPRKLVSPNYP